jgi:hypothetical protein
MTRPLGPRLSSPGSRSGANTRSVTSNTGLSRFDAVSSGPMIRNVFGFIRITSRRNVPSTRVASLERCAGWATSTA